jgi:type I restriction enzyme S subunit
MGFNQDIKAIRCNGRVDARYLAHWLTSQQQQVLCKVTDTSHGTKRLDTRYLQQHAFPCPLLPEQRAIAAVLDAADAAIERTRAAVAAARRVKRGLVQALLTRGIGADGRIRDPRRQPDKFTTTQHGTFPKTWEFVSTRDVAVVGSGVTLGKDLSGIKVVELPYLRVANVQDGYIDTSEMKTVRVPEKDVAQYLLQPGDVLMTEGGDFDKLGRGGVWNGRISPCLHQNHIFRVRPNQALLDPHYLGAVIASEYGKRYFMRIAKRTTNLASINKTQLNAFPFFRPPLPEQQRIVELLSAAECHIQAIEQAATAHERLKRGLMQVLLTGRMRVPVAPEKC